MVFYYDTSIIAARYLGIGGLGLMLTHWLTQFFVLDYAGAIITAVLGILATWMLWRSIPQRSSSIMLLPLCVLPVIFECHALFDVYYAYQGVVAYFLFTLFALICRLIADNLKNSWIVVACDTVLSLLLFYVAGAVATLLAAYLFVVEIVEHPRQCWRMLPPLAVILLAAAFSVSRAYLPLYRFALDNGAYYEPILEITNFFRTPWVLALVLPLISPLLQSLEVKMKPWIAFACSFVLIIALSGFARISAERNQQKMYSMLTLDHYVIKHDWKGLLASPYSQLSNYLLMNRVNLALSHEGRLLDDFYHYQQIAPYSLMTDLEQLSLDVEITYTTCEIYYQMDNIASADEKAFNSYEGLRYGSPSNLQMLVRTSLIFGRYAVAEKYIKLLEKTWYYADWAKSQRKFLYCDEAVNADPEYGAKRKSLLPLGSRVFIQAQGPYFDLLSTIRVNPKATAVRDYAIGYLLLANDIPHINAFADEFYGTAVMPKTPLRLQEALVAANETNLDYCRAHGVEEQTIQSYQQLKQALNVAKMSGSTDALSPWRDTYWYYLLVTSPNVARLRDQMKQQQEGEKTGEPVPAHG